MSLFFWPSYFFLFTSSFLFFHVLEADLPQPSLTLMIPMRDGFELPTDIYKSSDPNSTSPAILIRSPAGRQAHTALKYVTLNADGYTVVIQDTRSSKDIDGNTLPYLSDGWGELQDGYDTVEWLAQSPYSNGFVGTVGASALGMTQLMMAPSAPPSLKCQYIEVASPDLFHHAIFPGGQFLKNQVEGWLSLYAKHPDIYHTVTSQPNYNEFWTQFNTLQVAPKVKVPGVHVGGWHDIFLQGTIDGFLARQEQGGDGAKGTQKLVIGPWTHFWPHITTFGDFEVPVSARKIPFDITPKNWFDHYLKQTKNGIDQIPTVIYYVMGPFDGTASSGNVWKTAATWPIPAKETSYYLTKDKGLKGTCPTEETQFSYSYDPKDPVPTIGGKNLFLEAGPKDQRPIENREDVILFTTAPLEQELEMTGKVSAIIFFSTDQEDTDVVVKLTDVYPDGRSVLITDGIRRLGSLGLQIEKNKPLEVEIDLWSTSIVIAKGHRIRLSISSSNYPRFHANPNSLDPANAKIAKNSVWMGSSTASRLILPVVEKGPE